MAIDTKYDDLRQVAQNVRDVQAGNREAFGRLFERYERQVFAIAMGRLRDHADAQELCQDVFVQALEKIDQLRQAESFGSWLRSIAHRMSINRAVRRRTNTLAEPGVMESNCVDTATPLAGVLRGERDRHVRRGLDRLRELDRRTLVAFYVNGRSLAEMSDEFQAPLGTIKRRLHVARKRLAKEMDPYVAI